MADGHDPATGRFVKGHKKHPAAGRPPNAVNVITKTLREKVLDGFGDVTEFVSELKTAYPPAAAGLLARMMPPVMPMKTTAARWSMFPSSVFRQVIFYPASKSNI